MTFALFLDRLGFVCWFCRTTTATLKNSNVNAPLKRNSLRQSVMAVARG